MGNIIGKKLLVLGGNAISCDIVNAAKSLGLYTIVTDWNKPEKSPAKLIADEYWNDSLTDYDTLLPKIKEHHVDGIITGFTDSYLLPYQHICELSSLPCYATKEVFELTMNKARFKQLCRENDIPVIPEYRLADFDPQTITPTHKVIVKPVDNSGSRGVILCEKPEDFEKCLSYALSFSEKKQVVIEQYMEMDSISISYTIQDGVVSLSTTDDRYVHKAKGGSSVTCLGVYPSKYTDAYIEKIDAKLKKMFVNAGLRNGVLAIQFFTDGEVFYAMEMGHRLTGGQHYTYTQMENGVNALNQLIHFAITGSMADFSIAEKDNARFNHMYAHLFVLGREAKIEKIEGFEYLENLPETINATLMKRVGECIGVEGTAAQKIVSLHLKLRDGNHLAEVMRKIKDHFHVLDEEGNELVMELGK